MSNSDIFSIAKGISAVRASIRRVMFGKCWWDLQIPWFRYMLPSDRSHTLDALWRLRAIWVALNSDQRLFTPSDPKCSSMNAYIAISLLIWFELSVGLPPFFPFYLTSFFATFSLMSGATNSLFLITSRLSICVLRAMRADLRNASMRYL